MGPPTWLRARSRRQDGFVPIEDYAVLGDGRTVALVATDGQVDWWPVPTLDSPPVCAALLDPARGGHFGLAPVEDFDSRRRYVEGTNVLETEYRTASGTVRVTESLTSGAAGRLPWTELARRVEGVDGSVELRWDLAPGDRFGTARAWVAEGGGVPVLHVGDQMLAVVTGGSGAGPVEVATHELSGRIRCSPGDRCVVAAVATDDEPLFMPNWSAVSYRLDRTVESWRRWTDQITVGGRWAEAVRRSALALKLLLYEPAGAMAAAATTSLPEWVGGSKNWDYRYAWVRDSSFALDALINLDLHEEVHRAVSWLLGALESSKPDLHIFYRLDGTIADEEAELDVPGYRGSRPVLAGNAAGGQLQLGVFGDLFDTIHRYVREGHVLDPGTGSMLARMADRCCDLWMRADSGIWELNDLQQYTISRMGCWVAVDRAARLADDGQIPGHHAERWRAEAGDIKTWVDQHCWSSKKQAWTFHPGTERLDAAVLLAGRTGFDRGPRLSATIDAIIAELARGPLVYRYTGMDHEEGAFVACTFWLIDALVHVGRVPEARSLMEQAVDLVNDVGLLSEQIDPGSGAFLGNVPQGLSHLALINAAHSLERAEGSRG